MKEWLDNYFKETWEEVNPGIDFSQYTPISTSGSLHVHEERYEIEGKIYRLLYPIGKGDPIIEVLCVSDTEKSNQK
jgi:transcription termination factor Rho